MISRKKQTLNLVIRQLKLSYLYSKGLKLICQVVDNYIRFKNDNVKAIWLRNALALGYDEPGVSDLDLTLLLKAPLQPHELIKLRKDLNFVKKIFPMTGDYTALTDCVEDLNFIQKHQNFFELFRDPALKALLPKSALNTPSDFDRLVFFHKMLISNYFDVEQYPELRTKKWIHHFKLLQFKIDKPLFAANLSESLWQQYTSLVNSVFRLNLAVAEIKPLFDRLCNINTKPLHLTFDEKCENWFYVLNINLLCFIRKDLSSLSSAEIQVLFRVVQWEVVGLKHNLALVATDYSKHFSNLKMALDQVAPVEQKSFQALLMVLEPDPQAV